MQRNKRGISLIVLVITIIVMIILAAAVMISLSNTGILDKANDAVDANNLKNAQNIATLAWTEAYLGGARTKLELEQAVTAALAEAKLTGYDVMVNEKGVTVNQKEELVAGLYDANGTLLASWEVLVNDYGLDISLNYNVYDGPPGYYKTTTSSGYYVFNNYDELSTGVNLVIGDNITTIGEGAFMGCTSLESIIIPDSVVTLGRQNTFESCTNLKNVKLSNNIIEIPNAAFLDCISLTSIDIPDGVTDINSSAFQGCISLKNVSISNNVQSIDNSAFAGCDSLIYNKYDNAYYLGNESNPYCALIKAINTSITNCEINTNTKMIADCAFNNCSMLESVEIPYGVITIGSHAFGTCVLLTNVVIPDSVTVIDTHAYTGCRSLANIHIPDSVTIVGYDAFYGCSSLAYSEYNNAYYLGNEDNPYHVLVKANETITSITINNNTKIIAEYALSICNALTDIKIPDSVILIGTMAFACRALENIVYDGTTEQWNKIELEYYWNFSAPATEVKCSNGNVAL